MIDLILDGKISVITGAGSGVGRAMANLFATQGSKVTVVDVVSSRVDEVVREISRPGMRAGEMVRDLSKISEPEAMIDEVVKQHGRIDILCNNAGIMDAAKPAAETSDELWDRVMSTNLAAPFRASRRAIPVMIEHGGGVILNTASVAGLFGGRAGVASLQAAVNQRLRPLRRSQKSSPGRSLARCSWKCSMQR